MKSAFIIVFLWFWTSYLVNSAAAQNWIKTTNSFREPSSLASSANGGGLALITSQFPHIEISADSGATWTLSTNSPDATWVACSADGTMLAAAVKYDTIYVSTNAGTTWTPSTAPSRPWTSVASSADGNKLVAVSGNGVLGSIYTSTNAGVTWLSNTVSQKTWVAVASSADGDKLVATGSDQIYTTTNAGAAWISNNVPLKNWISLASSADGNKLIAANQNGGVYTTTNAGALWVSNNIFSATWVAVASSADGNTLLASSLGVYVSTNAGSKWILSDLPAISWDVIAASADGNRLIAGNFNGDIYVSQTTSSPSLNITRSDSDAIVSWLIPSMNFTLQQNFDFTTTNWVDATNTLTLNLTNLQNEVVLPLSLTGNRFSRLKLVP